MGLEYTGGLSVSLGRHACVHNSQIWLSCVRVCMLVYERVIDRVNGTSP